MVRSELLRAKSLHAEVAYLRDLQRVGDAKRIADQHNGVLQEREKRFWAEAIRGKATQRADGAGPGDTRPAERASLQLERMRRAHTQFQEAHQTHQTAVHSLKEGLATLGTSQKRIEVLEKLLAKAQRLHTARVESRFSDEVADLVVTSKAVLNLRAARTTDSDASMRTPLSEMGQRVSLDSDRPSAALQLYPRSILSSLCSNAQTPAPVPFNVATHTIATPVGNISGRFEPIGISNLSYSTVESQPRLSLSCSLGARGTVGLQITRADSGGLKVVIDPSASTVASGVLRDKLAIQARLQALGVKVSSIEIAAADDATGLAKGTKRSRLSEEEDEGAIS